MSVLDKNEQSTSYPGHLILGGRNWMGPRARLGVVEEMNMSDPSRNRTNQRSPTP